MNKIRHNTTTHGILTAAAKSGMYCTTLHLDRTGYPKQWYQAHFKPLRLANLHFMQQGQNF